MMRTLDGLDGATDAAGHARRSREQADGELCQDGLACYGDGKRACGICPRSKPQVGEAAVPDGRAAAAAALAAAVLADAKSIASELVKSAGLAAQALEHLASMVQFEHAAFEVVVVEVQRQRHALLAIRNEAENHTWLPAMDSILSIVGEALAPQKPGGTTPTTAADPARE